MKNGFKGLLFLLVPLASSMLMVSCGGSTDGKLFTYEDISFTDSYGSKTNSEAYDYSSIKVNPIDNALRDDFAYGVDISMVQAVEEQGGVYYNKDGREQDIFQILRRSGVNFARFRLWNKPSDKYGRAYGGGNNDLATDIALAKRAKAANMNVLIDFHYSDFWADPDDQWVPKDWAALSQSELPNAIKTYTAETLQAFKDEGITVDAVQIGNEINNGMCSYSINWNDIETSFTTMADMLKGGIEGAKSVFPNVRSIIHLANGGNTAEFETFFSAMSSRNVNYDIIGASYYPYLSGSMDNLQANLDNVSSKLNKPVMIMETSWGYTLDYNVNTANQYSEAYEDTGGYLTSIQAQATEIRDIVNVLSNVPDSKGLGIFYWEPDWLPVAGAGWATINGKSYKYYGDDYHSAEYKNEGDGLATWSNQGLFSYTGKALPSIDLYKYLKDGFNPAEETSLKARSSQLELTINLAASETLPSTAKVETDFDAIRDANMVWSSSSIEACKAKGTHNGMSGTLDGKYAITANVVCIENYVVDPGFENQGETDIVKAPWSVDSVTPAGDKVVKLDRKSDTRSGTTDLNWYHSTDAFTFEVSQTIAKMPKGTYALSTYLMGPLPTSTQKNTKLDLYIEVGSDTYTFDGLTCLQGWSSGYHQALIEDIVIDSDDTTVKIGLIGAGNATAWGHNDDWALVSVD